jgi:hypothetical protein
VAVHRRTTIPGIGAAVLCVALTGCGASSNLAVSPPSTSPPTASTRPSPSHATSAPARNTEAARTIVDDPKARIGAFSVIPGHPERRIAEWYVCRDRRCYHRTYALVVSADGFRTSHLVDHAPSRVANGWYLEPAGPDRFTIAPNGGRRSLVDLTGRVTAIHVAGRSGPLAGREVPVMRDKGSFLAVDPHTGEAHPLSTPDAVIELQQTPSGQLRGITLDHPRYFWSADGGATWHEIPLPPGTAQLWAELVPTPSDALHVLVLGGENTVFPWDRVLKSTDGRTWTSYDGPTDPTAYVDESVVLPDGRLLMNIDGWSDQWRNRPSVNVPGFWAGLDWTHLRPVPPAGPFAGQDVRRFVPTVLDIAVTGRSVILYALVPEQSGVVSSTDGGATWQPEAAR